jgi:hypothetical protein
MVATRLRGSDVRMLVSRLGFGKMTMAVRSFGWRSEGSDDDCCGAKGRKRYAS